MDSQYGSEDRRGERIVDREGECVCVCVGSIQRRGSEAIKTDREEINVQARETNI